MTAIRAVTKTYRSRPTLEGAGVRLNRAIGWGDPYEFDPFLLLDDIHSSHPDDYTAGFPWHPHRGIETVTYVLDGVVEHGDSLGNGGAIRSGDVQWMTAGGGIVHQEMPKAHRGDFRGLQLWVNLPRSHKMMAPRYRGIEAKDIPECGLSNGGAVKVVGGDFDGIQGAAHELVRAPIYLDVSLSAGRAFTHPLPPAHNALAYVLTGSGTMGAGTEVAAEEVVSFGPGDAISARAGGGGLRFLLFSGEPLREPIAWRGPIVMNTQEELDLAFRQYREGTFLRG